MTSIKNGSKINIKLLFQMRSVRHYFVLCCFLFLVLFFILTFSFTKLSTCKTIHYETICDNTLNNIESDMENRHIVVSDPIDVVITWVDSTDPEWVYQKSIYEPKDFSDDFDCRDVRYSPHNGFVDAELRICVELIMKHLPFIRNIHVVVARSQGCKWFSKYPKIRVVYHDQIWPDEEGLPTFSSSAIETCLHHIPGLSEKFIYFNDDTYITKPLDESSFFDFNDRPIHPADVVHKFRFHSVLSPESYHYQWIKLFELLEYSKILVPKHMPMSLTRTLMREAESFFGDVWKQTRVSRFRSRHSIPPIGACMNLNGLIWSPHESYRFKYLNCNDYYYLFDIMSKDPSPDMICVNNCNEVQVHYVYNTLCDIFEIDVNESNQA